MMDVDEYKKVRFEGEESGEETLFLLRPHAFTNIGWIFFTLVFLMVPLIFLIALMMIKTISIPLNGVTTFLIVAVWILITIGFAYQQFLNWYFNIYMLTNKRIVDIDFFGLFHRRVSTTTLANVQDITYTKAGIIQNFLDFGNIHIQTAGTQANFEFYNIPDPEGSQKQIFDLLAKYKRGSFEGNGTRPDQTNQG